MRLSAAGMPTLAQQAQRRGAGRGSVHRKMGTDGFGQLVTDGQHRMQRGERILEDGADLAAADLAHGGWCKIVDALALEPDGSTRDASGRVEQTDDRGAGERLAGARLTDHAQDLSRQDVEGHPVDGGQRPVTGVEHHMQVPHRQQGVCCWGHRGALALRVAVLTTGPTVVARCRHAAPGNSRRKSRKSVDAPACAAGICASVPRTAPGRAHCRGPRRSRRSGGPA
jgi:hypothetical protein